MVLKHGFLGVYGTGNPCLNPTVVVLKHCQLCARLGKFARLNPTVVVLKLYSYNGTDGKTY